jgi:eukaryotic-like serine/threonine-protein kinase
VPPGLQPLLRAALDRDPARRPSAARAARWVRAVDLGEPDVTASEIPAATGSADDAVRGALAGDAAGAAPAGDEGRVAPAREPAPRPPLGVYKILAYLSVLAVSAVCALLPLLGGAGTVLAAWYLRVGDVAVRERRVEVRRAGDLVFAPVRTRAGRFRAGLVALPAAAYAGLVAGAAGLALFAAVRQGGTLGPGTITKGAAFAFGYATLAGPGMMAPRRQLVRLLSAVAPDRRATARAALVLTGLTAAAVLAARVRPPSWWPSGQSRESLGRLARPLADLLNGLW